MLSKLLVRCIYEENEIDFHPRKTIEVTAKQFHSDRLLVSPGPLYGLHGRWGWVVQTDFKRLLVGVN